jgi:hypothetical protein
MAIQLPPPPKQNASPKEWEIWWESLWRYVRGDISNTGDVNASIGTAAKYHGVTALSAPRIIMLPLSDSLRDGDEFVIQDESGSAGTHTISVAAQGADTVLGTTTITTNYGRRTVIKRGVGKFFSA